MAMVAVPFSRWLFVSAARDKGGGCLCCSRRTDQIPPPAIMLNQAGIQGAQFGLAVTKVEIGQFDAGLKGSGIVDRTDGLEGGTGLGVFDPLHIHPQEIARSNKGAVLNVT